MDHKPALSPLSFCTVHCAETVAYRVTKIMPTISHVGAIHFVSSTSLLKCLSGIFSKLSLRGRCKLRRVSTGSRSLQELKLAFKSWGYWARFHCFLLCFNSIAMSQINFCHTDDAKSWHYQLSNLCGKTCLPNSAVTSCQQAGTQLAEVWRDSPFCFQHTLLFFSQVPSQLIRALCTAKDNVCSKCCFCLPGRDWLGKSQHIAGYLHIHLEMAAAEVVPWNIRLGRGQGSSSVLQSPMVRHTEAKQRRPVLKQQQWGEGKHQNSSYSSLAFFQPPVQQAQKKTEPRQTWALTFHCWRASLQYSLLHKDRNCTWSFARGSYIFCLFTCHVTSF